MNELLNFLLQSTIVSFICCLADRASAHLPLFTSRSYCFHCQHQLAWHELIPIFSAVRSGLRCTKCHFAFTSLPEWFLFELFIPLSLTVIPTSYHPSYWLIYPLLFVAREDSQTLWAHSDFLYLFVPMTLLQAPQSFQWTKFLLLVELCLLTSFKKMGVGDLPVFLLACCVFNETDFFSWLFVSAITGLFIYSVLQHPKAKIPFIPLLLFAWLVILLKHSIY